MLYSYPHTAEMNLINSRQWYARGMDHIAIMNYDDALVCFDEALRLGHPQSAKAIALCNKRLTEI